MPEGIVIALISAVAGAVGGLASAALRFGLEKRKLQLTQRQQAVDDARALGTAVRAGIEESGLVSDGGPAPFSEAFAELPSVLHRLRAAPAFEKVRPHLAAETLRVLGRRNGSAQEMAEAVDAYLADLARLARRWGVV